MTAGEHAPGRSASERTTAADVFRNEYRFVRRFLRRWGVPAHALDDAIQDVFVIVTRRLGELEDDAKVRSWLVSICRRVAANQRRSDNRLRTKLRALAGLWQKHRAARSESLTLMETLLGQLSEEQRVVVTLMDIEGWTAAEVADALELPAATVYSRRRLARSKLREAYLQRRSDGGSTCPTA